MSSYKWGTSSFLLVVGLLLALPNAKAQVNGPQAVAGEYIVKFKAGKSAGVAGNIRVLGKLGSSIAVKAVFGQSGMMHVKVSSEAAKNALASSSEVEFMEPNYILSVNPSEVSALGSAPQPTDDYVQSGSDTKVRVSDAWAIEKPYNQGSKVVVAVIDTGLDTSHELFSQSGGVWSNTAEVNGQSGVDDDGNGFIDDKYGWNFNGGNANVYDDNDHGTHVSGIILGVGQDVVAYPVRESKVRIMPLKFLDANGSGSTSNAVSAIYYAVRNGAKVINNSWGGSSYSQALHEAYTYAYNNGVVIASAAGNSNSNNDSVSMYPANIDSPNNIVVAASDDNDARASFSNYGHTTVNLAAPGVRILSSVPGTGCLAPGCYQMMSGTSMATPFVAGLAALVLREAPQLSAYQVKSIIIGSVDALSSWSTKVASGGRVNVYKTITNAKAAATTAPWSPAYEPDYKASRGLASDANEVAAPAGCGLVKALVDEGGAGGGGTGQAIDLFLLFSFMAMPIVIAVGLRAAKEQTALGSDRRVHQRYAIAKQAVLEFAGQAMNIMTDDISAGGLAFSTNVSGLSKGQILDVNFGGSDKVKAEVVWHSEQKGYGLRFLNAPEGFQKQFDSWTSGKKPLR